MIRWFYEEEFILMQLKMKDWIFIKDVQAITLHADDDYLAANLLFIACLLSFVIIIRFKIVYIANTEF